MLLSEFRRLTEELDGDLELLCAGGPVDLLWHDDDAVSIDNASLNVELGADARVLYDEHGDARMRSDDDG